VQLDVSHVLATLLTLLWTCVPHDGVVLRPTLYSQYSQLGANLTTHVQPLAARGIGPIIGVSLAQLLLLLLICCCPSLQPCTVISPHHLHSIDDAHHYRCSGVGLV